MTRIAIIGNGKIAPSLCTLANEADYIVRFNQPGPESFGAEPRTDLLVISNSSKQTKALLHNPSYLNGPIFQSANALLFPYSPEIIAKFMPKPNPLSALKGARADLTGLCTQAAKSAGKKHQILDSQIYLNTCAALAIQNKDLRKSFPSSGIITIHYLTNNYSSETQIEAYGFGFQGWKRHNWSAEKAYVERLIQAGRLTLPG
jgi:hypothetical protein